MKKKIGLFLAGILCVGLGSSTVAQAALKPGDPVRGKKIYRSFCVQCHGIKGNGQGPAAGALMNKPANFTDPALWASHDENFFLETIRHGRGGMAPYWDVLTPQQILDVLSYEKKFRKK